MKVLDSIKVLEIGGLGDSMERALSANGDLL